MGSWRWLSAFAVVAAIAALLASAGSGTSFPVMPKPGDIDLSYGTQGLWKDNFPGINCPGDAYVGGVAPLSDGSLVIAGSANQFDTNPCTPVALDFLVAKIDPIGGLDEHFGDSATVNQSGWTHTHFAGTTSSQADAVAIQPDGKVVVAGIAAYGTSGDSAFAIARYNSDGTLDTSFGAGCNGSNVDGTQTVMLPGSYETAHAIGFQSDGKIIVVGAVLTVPTDFDFGIVRLTTAGCPDSTFGPNGDGTDVEAWPAGGNDWAYGMFVQPTDKIVVAGRVDNGSSTYDYGIGMLRLTSSGSLDTTFGVGGRRFTELGGCNCLDGAYALTAQPDGKLIAVGAAHVATGTHGEDFVVARYSASGAPDASFGSGGKVLTDFGKDDTATSVLVDPAGLITAFGYGCCDSGGYLDWHIARYTPTHGALDPTFGTGGKVVTDMSAHDSVGPGADLAGGIAYQASTGNYLLAGQDTLYPGQPGQDNDAVVARYYALSPAAPDGSGTLSVAPAAVRPASLGNTLTFTYTADPGGLRNGTVTIAVPNGWSAPSTSPRDRGYCTTTKGTRTVVGQTIVVSNLTLTGDASFKITYGGKTGGGAQSPPTPLVQSWDAQERSTVFGTLTDLSNGSPGVTIASADGSGTMDALPTTVTHATAGQTLTFTYTAVDTGLVNGTVSLLVPAGWSAPSASAKSPGDVTVDAGTRTISGRTITVSNLTLGGGDTLTITYGSTAGGGPGALAPKTAVGSQTWSAKERSLSVGTLVPLAASPAVAVG